MERTAVKAYHEDLCRLSPAALASYSLEQCWGEYVAGGLGRWIWFLPILDSMCPPKMTQYFNDQVQAFIVDHQVTADNSPMPRV